MAVVINEFEVVSAPAPAAPSEPAQAPPTQLTPRDVEMIVQRAHARAVRVRAH